MLFRIGAIAAATLLAGPLLSAPAGAGTLQHLCAGTPATKVGTAKADVIHGTPGRDVIVGLGGNDTIYGMGEQRRDLRRRRQ